MLEVISTCHFALIFKFHMSSTFHLIYCTNCKFKVLKLVKAINGSVSMDQHDNFGHPISKCNTMFCLKLFQLAISLLYSNFICPHCTNCKFKVRKLVKAINMEVYQWINMIIMVIQFSRVTFCFAWSYFNLPFHSYFQISSYLLYKLQIQSTKVGESY